MSPSEVRVRKEMGISHKEFFRVLPRLLAGRQAVVSPDHVVITGEGRRVEIRLEPEQERRMGGVIRLPVTWVELVFYGYGEEERKGFEARFDQHFFRGGG